jgi:hypothetical protein
LFSDLLLQRFEGLSDQARNVHLRDPELDGDLALREPVEEPEVQNLPFTLAERTKADGENGPVFRRCVPLLIVAQLVDPLEVRRFFTVRGS